MVINYTIHSKQFPEGSALTKEKAMESAKFRESKGDKYVMVIEHKRNESNAIYQTTK